MIVVVRFKTTATFSSVLISRVDGDEDNDDNDDDDDVDDD